jgi:hypothetical protein
VVDSTRFAIKWAHGGAADRASEGTVARLGPRHRRALILAMTLSEILAVQARWAAERFGRHCDGRNAPCLDDNLIQPLTGHVWDEFAAADGNELGRGGRQGKMQSLRSSAALCYNVFAPWRGRPVDPLTQALGLTGQFHELRFEQKLRHGVRGRRPNLDVVLQASRGSPVGIESKYSEPYSRSWPHPPLNSSYFANNRRYWAELGLPRTQALAEGVGTTLQFRRLEAGQLVKHILGLAASWAQRPVRFVYLWFDCGCSEADEHRREVEAFAEALGGEIEFFALTYQELFRRLCSAPEPCANYRVYLAGRYFPRGAAERNPRAVI